MASVLGVRNWKEHYATSFAGCSVAKVEGKPRFPAFRFSAMRRRLELVDGVRTSDIG